MIELILLALAPSVQGTAPGSLCLPVASDQLRRTPSAVDDHRKLREAIGEPMPQSQTMIMLYGKGGHLATVEYSIIVTRSAEGTWRGTAVGRSQIWIQDAPYTPSKRAEWVLDEATGHQLDSAINRRCAPDFAGSPNTGPPPRGLIPERIDVVMPGHPLSTFYSDAGDGRVAALIRPPRSGPAA